MIGGQVDTELDTRGVNIGASKVKVCDRVASFPTPARFRTLATRLTVTSIYITETRISYGILCIYIGKPVRKRGQVNAS